MSEIQDKELYVLYKDALAKIMETVESMKEKTDAKDISFPNTCVEVYRIPRQYNKPPIYNIKGNYCCIGTQKTS